MKYFVAALIVVFATRAIAAEDYVPWPNAAGRGTSANRTTAPQNRPNQNRPNPTTRPNQSTTPRRSTTPPARPPSLEEVRRQQQRLLQRPGNPNPIVPRSNTAEEQRRSRERDRMQSERFTLQRRREEATREANRPTQQIRVTRDPNGNIRATNVPGAPRTTNAQTQRVADINRRLHAQEELMTHRGHIRSSERTVTAREAGITSRTTPGRTPTTTSRTSTTRRSTSPPAVRAPLTTYDQRNTFHSGPINDAINRNIRFAGDVTRNVVQQFPVAVTTYRTVSNTVNRGLQAAGRGMESTGRTAGRVIDAIRPDYQRVAQKTSQAVTRVDQAITRMEQRVAGKQKPKP